MSNDTGKKAREFTAWLLEENRKLIEVIEARNAQAELACKVAPERIEESRPLLEGLSRLTERLKEQSSGS